MYTYKTKGVCSTQIDFDIEDGIIKNVVFHKGCDGNLSAISTLVKGMKTEDVINKLKGLKCGMNSTSCPDQLAKALESMNPAKM